jgi:hypothetical protein
MANDTTPLMLITNVGLAAASTALPQGPYIHIIEFQIGSAYGYTPDVNQTAIQGNLLFTGTPSDYVSIGDNTLNIILEIPPEAGPWEFGEVAIFAADSNNNPYLFAIAVFASPQTKFSSLGTNVVSSYQLNCLLKLQQSTAIFQIDSENVNPDVYDIYQWSDVYPPSLSANPGIPSYNIHEPNSRGEGTMLLTTTTSLRSLVDGAYQEIFPDPYSGALWTVANSSSTYVEVTQATFNSLRTEFFSNRSLLIQTHAGFWRSVNNIAVSGANYRLNLNCTNDGTYNNYPLPVIPQLGEQFHIYSDSFSGKVMLYDQVVNPPAPPPVASVGTPGLAYGDTGTYMPGGGRIQVYGLLQSPSTNTGRTLSGADNLNNTNWPSGFFTIDGESFGYPANMPVQIDGHVWMHAENPLAYTQGGNANNITQIFYPAGTGGGDSNGVNGYPPYWREWNASVSNGQGGWTNWFALNVIGKQGGGSTGTTTIQTITSSFSQTIAARCHIHIWVSDGNPNNTTALYKNGNIVSRNSKGGGSGYGRVHHDHCLFFPGETMQYITSGSVGSPITMVTDTF